jgi:chromosome segregation ATPase
MVKEGLFDINFVSSNSNEPPNKTVDAVNTIYTEVNKARAEIDKLNYVNNNENKNNFNINLTSHHDLSNVIVPLHNIYSVSSNVLGNPNTRGSMIDLDNTPNDTSIFEEALRKQRKNINELLTTNEDLKRDLNASKTKIKELEKENIELKEEKRELEKKLNISEALLKQNEDELFKKLKSFLTQIGDKTKGYSERLKSGELLHDGKKYLDDLNSYMDVCFKILMNQIDANNDEIAKDKKEIEELKKERIELKKRLEEQRTHIDKLVLDLESYKKKCEQGRNDFHENIKFLMEQINQQEENYELLNTQLDTEKKSNQALNEQIALLNVRDAEKDARINALIAERAELQTRLYERTESANTYFMENNQLKIRIDELQRDNDILNAQKAQLETNIQDNELEIGILNIQLEAKVIEVNDLKQQLEAKEQNNMELNANSLLQRDEKNRLDAQLVRKDVEIEHLLDQKNIEIEELRQTITTKNRSLLMLRGMEGHLIRQLEEKVQEKKAQEELLNERTAERDQGTAERLGLNNALNAKDTEIAELKIELAVSANSIVDLHEENEALVQQLNIAHDQNLLISAEINQLRNENVRQRASLFAKEEENRRLNIENRKIRKELQNKTKEYEDAKETIDRNKQYIATLFTTITAINVSFSEEEIKARQDEISQLKNQLSDQNKAVLEQEKTIKNLERSKKAQDTRIKNLKFTIEGLNYEISRRNERLIEKENEKKSMQLIIDKKYQRIGELEEFKELQNTTAEEKDQRIGELEREFTELQNTTAEEKKNMQSTIDKLKQGKADLEKQIRLIMINLNSHIYQYKNLNENLEGRIDSIYEQLDNKSLDYEQLKTICLETNTNVDKLVGINKSIISEKEQCEEQYNTLLAEYHRTNETLETAQAAQKQLTEELYDVKVQNNQTLEEKERDIERLSKQNKIIGSSFINLSDSLLEKDRKIRLLELAINQWNKIYSSISQEKNSFRDKLMDLQRRFNAKSNDELLVKVDSVLEINSQLELIQRKLKEDLEAKNKEIQTKDEEIARITFLSSRHKRDLLSKTKRLKKMTIRFHKELLLNSQLNNRISGLVEDVSKKTVIIGDKRKIIKDLRNEIKKITEENKITNLESERKILELQSRVEKLEANEQTIQAELESKTQEIELISQIVNQINDTRNDKKENPYGSDVKEDLINIKEEIKRLMQIEEGNGNLASELSRVRQLLSESEHKNQELIKKIDEMNRYIEENITTEKLMGKKGTLKSGIETLKFHITTTQKNLELYQTNLLALQRANKLIADEKARLEKALEKETNINEENKKEIKALKSDNERINEQLSNELDKNEKSTEEIVSLKKRLVLSGINILILEKTIEKNKVDSDKNYSELLREKGELERINREQTGIIEEKKLIIDRLNAQIVDNKKKLGDKNKRQRSQNKKLYKLLSINQKISKGQTLTKSNSIFRNEIKTDHIGKFLYSMDEKKEEHEYGKIGGVVPLFDITKEEIEKLQQKIAELEEKNLQLGEQSARIETQNSRLDEENKTIRELNSQLSESESKLKEKDKTQSLIIKTLNSEIKKKEEKEGDLEVQIEELKKLESTNNELMHRNRDLRADLDGKEKKIKEQADEIVRISNKNDEIERLSNAQIKEIQAQIENKVAERTAGLQETISEIEFEKGQIKRTLSRLKKTHDSTEEKINFINEIERYDSKNFLYKLYLNRTELFDKKSIDFYNDAYNQQKIKDIIKTQLDKIRYDTFKFILTNMKTTKINALDLHTSIRFVYVGYLMTSAVFNDENLFKNLLDVFKRNIFDNLNEFMRLIELLNPILVIVVNTDTSFCIGLIKRLLFNYLIRMLNDYFKDPILDSGLCNNINKDGNTPKSEFIEFILQIHNFREANHQIEDNNPDTDVSVDADNNPDTDVSVKSDELLPSTVTALINNDNVQKALGNLVDTRHLYKNNFYKPNMDEITDLIDTLITIAENSYIRDDINIINGERIKERDSIIKLLKDELLPLTIRDATVYDIRDKINKFTNKNSTLITGGSIADTLFLMFFNKYVCILVILLLVLLYFYIKCQRQKLNYRKSYRNYLLTINQN